MTEASTAEKIVMDLPAPFKDERGTIQELVSFEEAKMGSAVMITSKKGSVRANHYHKKDWHYCYIVSGSIEYHHRPVGDKGEAEIIVIKQGEVFYSPPMVEHAMVFLEDTVFLTLGGGTRKSEDYESDLVRVNLV